MNPGSHNARWAGQIVDALLAAGVRTVCIAPGSRSTPLVVAIADRPEIKTYVHIDERGLGFFALGVAKGGGRPVATVTTSGTAVANLLPAVVEASYDGVPLVVLSADRPPHLTDSGANQTIRQPGIFSHFVRAALSLPLPNATDFPMLMDRVGDILRQAQGRRPGPVHLNCPFEEPLFEPAVPSEQVPEITARPAKGDPLPPDLALVEPQKGILVIGQLEHPDDQSVAEVVARELGWPVVADVTSGIRHTGIPNLVTHYDLLLGIPRAWKTPSAILHLGGRMTSKAYLDWITAVRPPVWQFSSSESRWDPAQLLPVRAVGPLGAYVVDLLRLGACDSDWAAVWQVENRSIVSEVGKIAGSRSWSIVHVAHAVGQLPPSVHVFAGNSSAVRLLDRYTIFTDGQIHRVWANRGASGIDGTLATALGVAQGAGHPLLMVVGDLAALHDMNSLLMAPELEWPVVFVVLNNRGGGIFESLPVRQFAQFDRYFKTPHAVSFQKMADMFGLNYALADTAAAFETTLEKCRRATVSTLIEVPLG